MSREKASNSITLKGREISLTRKFVPINDLNFNKENPRVYSLVVEDGDSEPDQEKILSKIGKMEHVKQLIQSIKANGGVTDPLLVRGKDNVVIEGNSRLAAMRRLQIEDSLQWNSVKCDIINDDLSDDDIFSLLVQYHVIGKKDWDPFEKAGMFWRRYKKGESTSDISKDVKPLGLSINAITHMVNVYQFMHDHDELISSRWSYYDEYLKAQSIRKKREEYPHIDNIVTEQIKSGEIKRAEDIRSKLKAVCSTGGKTLRKYINGAIDLDEAHEKVQSTGSDNHIYRRLKKFREYITSPDNRIDIQKSEHKDKMKFELKRIKKGVDCILKSLDEEN